MVKHIFVLLIIFLTGCTIKPQIYDKSTMGLLVPVTSDPYLMNLDINGFSYEPPKNISAYTTSFLGCLQCDADGSYPGTIYEEKVSEIIKSEVQDALQGISHTPAKPVCQLSAKIHLVGWNILDGDSIVDLTYTLKENGKILLVTRIKGENDKRLFFSSTDSIERLFSKAVRNSVEQLMLNKEFLTVASDRCKR